MFNLVAAIINAAFAGMTGVFYATGATPFYLGVSIFCGLIMFVHLAVFIRQEMQ